MTKPRSDFYERKGAKKAISQFCRSCHSLSNAEYHKKNPDVRKRLNFKNRLRTYRLSEEEYNSLVSSYNGKCAICKKEALLCIDHNHSSGKVRGLLCHTCNYGIGAFKEDIASLLSAVSYLEFYENS